MVWYLVTNRGHIWQEHGWWREWEGEMKGEKEHYKTGKEGRGKLDKHGFLHVFFFSFFSFLTRPLLLVGLRAEDNSLSGNQMLIKRKLHWIGERKTGKIHPEKPHRSSQEGGGGETDRRGIERKGGGDEKNIVRSQKQIETRDQKNQSIHTDAHTSACTPSFSHAPTLWLQLLRAHERQHKPSLPIWWCVDTIRSSHREETGLGGKHKQIKRGEIGPLVALHYSSTNTSILSLHSIMVPILRQKSSSSAG